MTTHFKPHDHVSWNTPQGKTSGHVVRVIATHTNVNGHIVDASADEPQYEVESEKSGKRAVHRGGALTRVTG